MNILASLPGDEARALQLVAQRRSFAAGSLIVQEGNTDRWMGILLKGRAQVVKVGPDGRRFVIAHLQPGESFGELALLLDVPRNATIEALEACEVLELTPQSFAAHVQRFRSFERALLVELARRLHRTTIHAAQLALLDTTSRVLARLVALGERVETPQGQRVRVVINQREFAEELGTSREMVNKALRLLLDSGEIERSGKAIFVTGKENFA